MLQHVGQRVIVVLHHLLGFVGRLSVFPQETNRRLAGGEGAFDHARKDRLVNHGVVHHVREHWHIEDSVPACKLRDAVALLLDGCVHHKPERDAVLVEQRKLNCPLSALLLKQRPEFRDRHRHRQTMYDLLTAQIPRYKLLNQLLHFAVLPAILLLLYC